MALFLMASFSIVGMAHASPSSTVYTEDNAAGTNHVLQYESGSNGVLSLAGTFSTGGAGTGTALHSQGAVLLSEDEHWLLVVDAGSNQITVFQVSHDGSLSPLTPVSSHGTTPVSLTMYQNWVYVLDAGSGNIAGFVLGNSGALTYIAGSAEPLIGGAGSSPEQIGFSPHGSSIFVTEKGTNTIDDYAVDSNGVARMPTAIPSNGGGPYGFAFTSNGYLVLSEAGTGSLSSYAVSDSGSLRTISGAIPDFGGTPCWVAVSNDGRFGLRRQWGRRNHLRLLNLGTRNSQPLQLHRCQDLRSSARPGIWQQQPLWRHEAGPIPVCPEHRLHHELPNLSRWRHLPEYPQ